MQGNTKKCRDSAFCKGLHLRSGIQTEDLTLIITCQLDTAYTCRLTIRHTGYGGRYGRSDAARTAANSAIHINSLLRALARIKARCKLIFTIRLTLFYMQLHALKQEEIKICNNLPKHLFVCGSMYKTGRE
jgi:hypothetical protein